MAESEEELKNLSMKVKEESENVGLKLSIQVQALVSYIQPGLVICFTLDNIHV